MKDNKPSRAGLLIVAIMTSFATILVALVQLVPTFFFPLDVESTVTIASAQTQAAQQTAFSLYETSIARTFEALSTSTSVSLNQSATVAAQTLSPQLTLTAQTIEPSITPSPTQFASDNYLQIYTDRDLLVIRVDSSMPVSLIGIEFQVVGSIGATSIRIADVYDILSFTNGIAEPDSCFILAEIGTASPLPSVCNIPSLIYDRSIALSDVFWFDVTGNRTRDIAVTNNGVLLGICPSSASVCTISLP